MNRLILAPVILLLSGCHFMKEKVDLIVTDAVIYTVDDDFSITEAMAIKDGRIVSTGSTENILDHYSSRNIQAMGGKYIYPGWNDAHCHFTSYGLTLQQVDLAGTVSINEILKRCEEFSRINPSGWLTGRGWDQNDWNIKDFPDKHLLDSLFPDRPVLLKRIDGHAAWVNSKALEIADISAETSVEGGEIIRENGNPTGILIDNAISLVDNKKPKPGKKEIAKGLLKAQENCFSVGLTSLSDAELEPQKIEIIDSLQRSGVLKMRINAWLATGDHVDFWFEKGRTQNNYLTVGTIKLIADGALGSRGARMIKEYNDDPGNKGLMVTSLEKLREYCKKALDHGFQVATHCIGDEANRLILSLYGEMIPEGNDLRWRIEHAQIVDTADFVLFDKYNIIPSVQPTHATSDMYWAEERIGKERLNGAYAYKTLMEQNGWIPLGSDFPVESINPLFGFYAAITRKDHSGYPANGFLVNEALSREDALKGMTIWPAKAAFEEDIKGSLESGKFADFVVTEADIMTMDVTRIPELKVYQTYSGGKLVFPSKK